MNNMISRNMNIGVVSGGLFATGMMCVAILHAQLMTNGCQQQSEILVLMILCVTSFCGSFAQWRVE